MLGGGKQVSMLPGNHLESLGARAGVSSARQPVGCCVCFYYIFICVCVRVPHST